MACKLEYSSPKTPPKSRKRQLFYDDRPDNAKKLRSSRSQSTRKSSLSLKEVPVIRCACGRGPCSIFTSRSEKNPNRDFYTCFQRGSLRQCRFFRWVDEVLEFRVPQCPCGAGACSLNRDEKGRWFLACRIKKGQGACDFFQWAELRTNSKMNMHYHDMVSCACPDCLESPYSSFTDDEVAFWDIVIQVVESSNLEVLSTSSSVEDEIKNRDSYSIGQATESSICQILGTFPYEEAEVPNKLSETKSLDDPNLKKINCVTYMVSQSENDCKSVACMQMCAEGDIINQDDAMLSGVEGSAIGPNGVENSEVIIQQPPTPSKDAQLASGVSRCHPRCQSHNTRQNDSTSLSLFKHIGQGLLKTLEDKNLIDHQEMFNIAESVICLLSKKHSSFSTYVMKYIDYKARLAAVEGSMREGLSSQELEGIFKREAAECEAYESHFPSDHGESSCRKKRKLFRNLDKELEQSETETSEQKTNLCKINPELSARQRSMEAAWDEMEEALAKEIERKFLQDEARTALEKARAELPS